MSLENNIEALTAAILKLTNALGESRTASPAEKPKAEPKAEKPKAEKPEPKSEPEAEGVTLKQLGPALVGLMKKHGQDAGIAVLKKYDVKKVGELDPSQFADFLADLQKAMG